MRVKMLEDAPGSPDGVTVQDYTDGETYDVPVALGEVFVKYGLAEETDEAAELEPEPEVEVAPEPESKLGTGPTENK